MNRWEIKKVKTEFMYQCAMKDEQPLNPRLVKIGLIPKGAKETKSDGDESDDREEFLKEYVHSMEKMMFMMQHRVRQPVANIIGMAGLIEKYAHSPRELKQIAKYMQRSAHDLDEFTLELTNFIGDLKQKGKDKL